MPRPGVVATSTPGATGRRPVAWGVLTVAVLGSAASVWFGWQSPGISRWHVALINWLAWSYLVCGLVAGRRGPSRRFGVLASVTGGTILLTSLIWSTSPVLHTIGQAVDVLPLAMVLHVVLSFPSGALDRRAEQVVVTSAYVTATVGQLAVIALSGFPPPTWGWLDAPDIGAAVHGIELVTIGLLSLCGVTILLRRQTGRRSHRWSLVVLLYCFALGLVTIAVLLIVGVVGGSSFPTVQQISLALISLAPWAFLVMLLDERLARDAVRELVIELRNGSLDLHRPLAHALRDPTLQLAYWVPQPGVWVDSNGHIVDLPVQEPLRATTVIDRQGEPVAALMHDQALREQPQLLEGVSAAAAIALENGRLLAEQAAHLEELRHSRVRVIEAGQRERARLERNLHDGAQQRLVALSLELGLLEARMGADPAAKQALEQARHQIAISLDELRAVARGLHPAVLTGHGLPVALESLVADAAVPVSLHVDLGTRPSEAAEVAAYYVVCEGLANIGKHARATAAEIRIAREDGVLLIDVVDDGVGSPDPNNGSGLRGLADRVEAIGGRLLVTEAPGGGTQLRAEIPCG